MNQKVQEIVNEIEAVRQQIYAAVVELSQAQMDFKPAPDAWSVSEILSHLNKVERGLPKLYSMMLQKLAEAGWQPETEGSMLGSLDHAQLDVASKKFQAPERVLPQSGLSKAEILSALEQSRQAIVAAVAHNEFRARPLDDFIARMQPGGLYVDVKSQADAPALRARGASVWRL